MSMMKELVARRCSSTTSTLLDIVFVAFLATAQYGSTVVNGGAGVSSEYSRAAVAFPTTTSHHELDCKTAFEGKGKPAYGGKAHAGLVHPHGRCSPIKELAHLSGDMPKLALEILRRDEERGKSLHFMKARGVVKRSRSLAISTATGASGAVVPGASLGAANYIMKVGLGTPMREFVLILDSGSDLAWTQCLPCDDPTACYQQASPLFDPTTSTSYVEIPCATVQCVMCSARGFCQYAMSYGDGSNTTGDLSAETFTIGNALVENYLFGCGHNNHGTFVGVDGLLGLGWGDAGLPAQTVSFFGGIFTYCLPSMLASTTATGFIEFGTSTSNSTSVVSGVTPMIRNANWPSYYFVWLQAVSVGGVALTLASTPATAPTAASLSGTFVDSGAVITRFPATDYAILRDAFMARSTGITPISTPAGVPLFDACFQYNADSRVPLITLHFDGLDFPLAVENTLFPLDPSTTAGTNAACLAFAASGTSDQLILIGNYQMQGFLFAFDALNSKMGIQTTAKAC